MDQLENRTAVLTKDSVQKYRITIGEHIYKFTATNDQRAVEHANAWISSFQEIYLEVKLDE